jgi:hypothetical protein
MRKPSSSCQKERRQRCSDRKGGTLVLSVALMFALFCFLALSIDIGFLANSKAEMRRAADAAAMAGCWEIYQQLESGGATPEDLLAQMQSSVKLAAAAMAASNPVCNDSPVLGTGANDGDIQIGYLSSLQSSELSNDASSPYYAVRVMVSRTAEKNGEIPYFFGRIFGDTGRPLTVSATAVMARSIAGFQPPESGSETLGILPFALDLQTWNNVLAGGGSDNFAYDPVTGKVSRGADGLREMNLFPQGTGSPGNRGTVDIGHANNSTKDLARQIIHGISAGDLAALGKPLAFGANGTLTLNGDTGISAGIQDELTSIVGQKRIIPVFSSVSGTGNNADYTIVKWAGVRILAVDLTGDMSTKRVIVQPAAVVAQHAVVATNGNMSSDYLFMPVILAR